MATARREGTPPCRTHAHAAGIPKHGHPPQGSLNDLEGGQDGDDDAQYQDNFLPQAVAAQVKKEGASCDHWKRDLAGTSHYFRPLKYHGDGEVRQHGPNVAEETLPHVEGYYKLR